MTDDDVTRVTRNDKRPTEEIKLAIDLIASAAMIYYVTHPDCLDDIGAAVKVRWARFMHAVSVWNTRQAIRSLPETEPGES